MTTNFIKTFPTSNTLHFAKTVSKKSPVLTVLKEIASYFADHSVKGSSIRDQDAAKPRKCHQRRKNRKHRHNSTKDLFSHFFRSFLFTTLNYTKPTFPDKMKQSNSPSNNNAFNRNSTLRFQVGNSSSSTSDLERILLGGGGQRPAPTRESIISLIDSALEVVEGSRGERTTNTNSEDSCSSGLNFQDDEEDPSESSSNSGVSQ
jgi:hypothetical protein